MLKNMTFYNTSGDSYQVSNCNSHVSVYYEQNPEEEELISQLSPDDSCCSEAQILQSPPVEIHEECTVSIDLPPLAWHGYDNVPKILTVTNTGRTILINGQWTNSRPYIEGGPLSGNYLFSQIHFHCPSEHEIDGKRYPLEMHVVHYKTTYLTQERAMNEKDGTVVLVYLFKLVDTSSTPISSITKLAPQLEKINTRAETKDIVLSEIMKPFSSNYYVYWASVPTKRKSYLLQWIISANDLCVTKQEVEDLSDIITSAGLCGDWETTRMKPEDNAVFRVGEIDFTLPEVEIIPECTPCECHEVSYVSCKCRWKCVKNTQCKNCGNVPVPILNCSCKSQSTMCRDHCKLHSCCYQIERRPNVCRGTCQSEVMLPSSCCKREAKCAKSSEMYCDLVEGPDGKPTLSCTSANGCGVKDFTIFQKKSNKKNKCNKKRKCVIECGRVITSDAESTSKSSVDEEKIKKSEEEIKSKEDIDEETKPVEEKNSEPKPNEEENSDSKVQCIRFVGTEGEQKKEEKIKKKKKKKKDSVIVNSLDTIHGSQTKTSLNASEAIRFNMSTSSPFSSEPSDFDNGKSVRKKENVKCTPKQSSKRTISEKKSNTSSVLVQTDFDSGNNVPLETKAVNRFSKSRSKSSVNVENGKDSEVSEPEAISTLLSKSKTTLHASETSQKKKVSINTDSEIRDSTYSRTTASLRDSSHSKNERNKRTTDRPVSQSAQEVKCPIAIETLKCETKSPGDKSLSSNKLDLKKSLKRIQKKQSEEEKAKTKCKSSGQESKENSKSEITTLFEKKQNVKKETSITGDGNEVQINFLLTPPTNDTISIPSDALRTSESDCGEEKGLSEIPEEMQNLSCQPYTVNSVTIGPGIPPEELEKRSQVCLFMEHVFRSENKENQVYRCTSQEYHVAIMYDQYTLQEYKGKFHPQELQLGNYETLPLVPRYPEHENSNITLQDCTVMKETLDQICIRVKFLLSEKAAKWNSENKENKPEGPDKRPRPLVDGETQYSFHVSVSESKCAKESPFGGKTRSQGKTEVDNSSSRSLEIQKMISSINSNRKKETAEPQKCKIIVKKQSNARSKEMATSSSRDLRMQKNEGEREDKKLKPLFVKRRKTVYFMYDKVERDEHSGKKVFVGSFRTREETESLKKRKKIVPESESASFHVDDSSSGKYFLSLPNKEVDLEMLKLGDPSISSEYSTDKEVPSVSKEILASRKKDVVTLHKYKPKYSGMDRFKKECKNVLIGQVVNDLNKDNENYKDLAEIIGMEKEKSPRISIYELKEDTELVETEKTVSESVNGESKSDGLKVDLSKDRGSFSTFDVNLLEKHIGTEDSATDVYQKSPSPKDSQALILIPVEVESLSKVEVILIEHLKEGKSNQKQSGSSPLPSVHQ